MFMRMLRVCQERLYLRQVGNVSQAGLGSGNVADGEGDAQATATSTDQTTG